MAYTKKTWVAGSTGGTPITATELNRMEDGINDSLSSLVTHNFQAGAYTLALADAGKVVEINSAAAVTLTVPTNAAVAFPVGSVIYIRQYGAGQVTIGSTAVLRSRSGALRTAGQYAEAMLTKRATDEWVASGDLTI